MAEALEPYSAPGSTPAAEDERAVLSCTFRSPGRGPGRRPTRRAGGAAFFTAIRRETVAGAAWPSSEPGEELGEAHRAEAPVRLAAGGVDEAGDEPKG